MYFKSVLSHNVQLNIPTSNDWFVLMCDATMLGVGAVLNVYREGSELPVSFYSRQLLDRETRYTSSELECLAVVEAVKHYEVNLHGKEFVVQTDHKALQSLMSSNHLNRWLWRFCKISLLQAWCSERCG